MTKLDTQSVATLSIISTALDGVLAFTRGQYKRGLLLLGAAALSKRVTGLGTAVSVALRLVQKRR